MIEILQWSTLAICGLIAVARVPSAVRGENRTLFWIFALMTLAILLSIEAPYVAIDQALGASTWQTSSCASSSSPPSFALASVSPGGSAPPMDTGC